MNLKEIGRRDVDWIDLAQDRDIWRVLVNAVTKLRLPQNEGNFFTEELFAFQEGLCSMELVCRDGCCKF